MSGEWRHLSIGVLCDEGLAELQTGPFGSQLHAHDYVADGVAVVPTEAIRGRQIDHSVLPKITPAKAKSLERHRLRAGDILFARRGVQATGHIGYVRESEEGFICGTGAIRLRIQPGNSEVEPEFLSHVLANPTSVAWFKFHAIGATMPNLNEGIIRAFPLKLPPLSEQRAIAHILGTLDDKIELNRRMNATLEAMARALFQSWFVDFDPVRAKAEGRDPGLPKPLADLFPDRFEDSELGEIPVGWKVDDISAIAEVTSGKRPAEKFPEPTDDARIPLWGGNGPMAYVQVPLFEAPILLTGRVGTLGSVFRITSPCWPSDNTLVVLARKEISYEFLYLQLERLDFGSLNRGSTQPLLTQSDLKAQAIVLPRVDLLRQFHGFTKSMFERIDAGDNQFRILASFRDTLLPKLISGELRVKDAERYVKEITA